VSARTAFGENLRGHRERRGISLQTIAADTKVSASLYADVERGDCSRWPGGVYSRSYIRAYAQAVGLDCDFIVREFSRCFPETAWPDGAPTGHHPAQTATDTVPPPLRLTLDDSDVDRWRRAAVRLAYAAAELSGMSAAAGALTLAGADFWMTLAGFSLAYQVVRRALGELSPIAWIRHRAVGTRTDALGDLPLGPAESTV
jgi:transcriptional regulator with XRE-family HTH domain